MVQFDLLFVTYFALFIVVVPKSNPIQLSFKIFRNRFVMRFWMRYCL